MGSKRFTSARLDTKGKVQLQYGMIEIRMSTVPWDTARHFAKDTAQQRYTMQ